MKLNQYMMEGSWWKSDKKNHGGYEMEWKREVEMK